MDRYNPNIEDMIQAQQEHPLFDDFWKQRQVPLSQIKTPLLTCASWSTQGLHNRGSFEGFKQAASEEKWLYVHGRKEWESYYARVNLERQKSFFDFYLKEAATIGKIRLMSYMKLEINFIKANSNQRQRSLYLTQNIHHCI